MLRQTHCWVSLAMIKVLVNLTTCLDKRNSKLFLFFYIKTDAGTQHWLQAPCGTEFVTLTDMGCGSDTLHTWYCTAQFQVESTCVKIFAE